MAWQVGAEGVKDRKYACVAVRLGAELMNFAVDTSGVMSVGAARLVHAVDEKGER